MSQETGAADAAGTRGTGATAGANRSGGTRASVAGIRANQMSRQELLLTDSRSTSEFLMRAVAVSALFLLGLRVVLPFGLTSGLVVGAVLLPIWIQAVPKFQGARWILAIALVAIANGIILTLFFSGGRSTGTTKMVTTSMLLVTVMVGVGVIVWARTLLSDGAVAAWFGAGLLAGISPSSTLFASNPWRFGFSVAATVLVLGLIQMTRRRSLELLALLTLALISTLTDARSSFAMLLLCSVLVLWQARPKLSSKPGSAIRVLLALGVVAYLVYQLGQSLILGGYLGDETEARTEAQLDASGSLILGGRPELAATAALMRYQPWGFGSGTFPSTADLNVAKAGLMAIGYDPNNGYVERYMFGSGFEMHSLIGDLWANFGFGGLAFAALILVLTLRGVGRRVARGTASALLLYITAKTLWNLFFAPINSSIPLLILTLGLTLIPAAEVRAEHEARHAVAERPRKAVLGVRA